MYQQNLDLSEATNLFEFTFADMAPEGTGGSEPRAETPPPGAGGTPESAEESDGSDGFSEEY